MYNIDVEEFAYIVEMVFDMLIKKHRQTSSSAYLFLEKNLKISEIILGKGESIVGSLAGVVY